MVVMQPCWMPSFSWMTCSPGRLVGFAWVGLHGWVCTAQLNARLNSHVEVCTTGGVMGGHWLQELALCHTDSCLRMSAP